MSELANFQLFNRCSEIMIYFYRLHLQRTGFTGNVPWNQAGGEDEKKEKGKIQAKNPLNLILKFLNHLFDKLKLDKLGETA